MGGGCDRISSQQIIKTQQYGNYNGQTAKMALAPVPHPLHTAGNDGGGETRLDRRLRRREQQGYRQPRSYGFVPHARTSTQQGCERGGQPAQARYRVDRRAGKQHNIDTIKGIACRASGYSDFNKIPTERLRNLYNCFLKKQRDEKAVQSIADEYITGMFLQGITKDNQLYN